MFYMLYLTASYHCMHGLEYGRTVAAIVKKGLGSYG